MVETSSNLAVSFKLRIRNANNTSQSCFGLFSSRSRYVVTLQKLSEQTDSFTHFKEIGALSDEADRLLEKQIIELNKLCDGGNKDQRLQLTFLDLNLRKFNEFTFSVSQIEQNNLVQNDTETVLVFEDFQIFERKSQNDYYREGWKIQQSIAINFGQDSKVLHDVSSPFKTPLETALEEAGSTLDPYFQGQGLIPVWGFGSAPKWLNLESGEAHYGFALNGTTDHANAEVEGGIEAVLNTYRERVPELELKGDTQTDVVLRLFKDRVKSTVGQKVYHVLVMYTCEWDEDGSYVLFQLAGLPCSVIVVGLGNGKFDCENLDAWTGKKGEPLFDYSGKPIARSFVTFVNYQQASAWGNFGELFLEGLPEHFVSYMELNDGQNAQGQPASSF